MCHIHCKIKTKVKQNSGNREMHKEDNKDLLESHLPERTAVTINLPPAKLSSKSQVFFLGERDEWEGAFYK